MTVTFTLTSATSGTTASTAFNISGTTSSNVVSELATGVTKNQLTTGYTITGINDLITGGTIASISPAECAGVTTTWAVISSTPTPTPTSTPETFYNVYELCGWTDPSEQYKYIEYSNTYGSKGLVNGTDCASQVSSVGGIPYSEVQSGYPTAMPMGSFVTDPVTCAICN